MLYTTQLARDYPAWQKLGVEQFSQLPPSQSEIIAKKVGRKNIGAYGLFGTMFYDMAHHNGLAPADRRREVARQSILIGATFEVMDDTIDHPKSSRDTTTVQAFLENCWSTILDNSRHETVSGIALPEQQLASYGIAAYTHESMEIGSSEKRPMMQDVLSRLTVPVLRQLDATASPQELLAITEDITGTCTEATVLSSEFVDQKSYPQILQAARHFGAMSGVLDHGSEIIDDLKEGSHTYATAYLRLHGVSRDSLQAIKEIRKQAASEHYQAGKRLLESDEQRSIYTLAGKLLSARYATKRIQKPATPQKVEAALNIPVREKSVYERTIEAAAY